MTAWHEFEMLGIGQSDALGRFWYTDFELHYEMG